MVTHPPRQEIGQFCDIMLENTHFETSPTDPGVSKTLHVIRGLKPCHVIQPRDYKLGEFLTLNLRHNRSQSWCSVLTNLPI